VLALLAGLVLGNNGGAVLQWIGLPILAGAAIYLATALLTTGHTARKLFAALGALIVAALLLAAFLPPLAHPFFGWLGEVVAGWREGRGAVWWLAVSGVLILPALVMPASAVARRLTARKEQSRKQKSLVLNVGGTATGRSPRSQATKTRPREQATLERAKH
jgi:hypothetical protein